MAVSTLYGTAAWTPGIVGGNSSASKTVTVSGAVVGAPACAGFDQALPPDHSLHAEVTAADTVKVSLRNGTSGASNVGAGNVSAAVVVSA
jgi:hypothetical protein